MNELSITSIQKQNKIKLTSRTEAALTSQEVGITKENEMLAQLKQEIQDAQYAYKLMEAFEGRLREAYFRIGSE